MKCYKDIAVIYAHSLHVTEFLYPVILFGTLFTSFAIQAENPPEFAKHTLQREKTSDYVSSALQSGKRPEIEINEQSGVYQIKVVALIAAPANSVRNVLTDYKHIYRLNPSIIESDVLEQFDDGSVILRTKAIGCAAYFCKELERVEKVHILPSGDLHTEIVPELSQYKSGQTRWRIKIHGDYCEVTYFSNMEPDIYIPPVVGKFLIKKSLREGVLTSFANLEKISIILATRERLNVGSPNNNQTITQNISSSNNNTGASNAFSAGE